MPSDAITVRLGLRGLVVLGTHEGDYTIEVVAHYAAAEASCPRCDRTTRRVHQVHRQRKQDASLWAKPMSIVLVKTAVPLHDAWACRGPACLYRQHGLLLVC